jgi:phosphate starvation-inducible PhoH-like protein
MAKKSSKAQAGNAKVSATLGITARKQLTKGLSLNPKTENQSIFLDLLNMEGVDLVIGIGSAGTGKSYLAVLWGLMNLDSYERIIYLRPNVSNNVEADLGAMPGSEEEKLHWLRLPIYDILDGTLSPSNIDKLFEGGLIEISNVSRLRGRSLQNAIIIGDESQNLDAHLLKTILTRIGRGSKMILVGDDKQVDLRHNVKSAFREYSEKLSVHQKIGFVEFFRKDIVRNPLITEILDLIGEG